MSLEKMMLGREKERCDYPKNLALQASSTYYVQCLQSLAIYALSKYINWFC